MSADAVAGFANASPELRGENNEEADVVAEAGAVEVEAKVDKAEVVGEITIDVTGA